MAVEAMGPATIANHHRQIRTIWALGTIVVVLVIAVCALVAVTYAAVDDARRTTRNNGRIAQLNNDALADLACLQYAVHDRPPPAALNCP